MNDRFYPISKEKFDEIVLPLIVSFQNRSGRPTLISHYTFFCAIFYVLRTGVSWRDVPTEFGSWHTIYTRFKRWSESGLFWDLLYRLQQNKQIKVDIAWVDSTTIALHRHGGGSLKKKRDSM